MSLEMLNRGLEERIPRLYRHDAESFVWVLTYATVTNVEYGNHSVKISRPDSVQPWFSGDRKYHRSSKLALLGDYGRQLPVTKPYEQYLITVRGLIDYWVRFEHTSFDLRSKGSTTPDIDDPDGVLRSLIKGVETALGADTRMGFAEVSTLLLEAIKAPKDV